MNPLINQTSFLQVTGQTNRHQLQQVRVAEFAAKGEGKADFQGKSEMKSRKVLACSVFLSIGHHCQVFTGIYFSVNVFFTEILNFKRPGVGRKLHFLSGEEAQPQPNPTSRGKPHSSHPWRPQSSCPTCCAPALPGGDQPGAVSSSSAGDASSAPSLSLCCLPTSSYQKNRNSYQMLPAVLFPSFVVIYQEFCGASHCQEF